MKLCPVQKTILLKTRKRAVLSLAATFMVALDI
jgi:hypothetical protein